MTGAVSTARGLPKRNWVDYSAREFAALKRDKIVAILPLGATEQHGPHLPLSVDACIVDGVVDRLASRLPAESPVLFLPTQAVTKSVEHANWPGTLYLSSETVMRTTWSPTIRLSTKTSTRPAVSGVAETTSPLRSAENTTSSWSAGTSTSPVVPRNSTDAPTS